MTVLDIRFRKLSTDLIDRYGKSVTLTNVTTGSYNTATSSITNTTSDTTVKALVEDYSLHSSGAGFDSGLILSGDKKFSIAAAGITTPKPGDSITLDSVLWKVVRVTEVWSGEQIAMYELQARK